MAKRRVELSSDEAVMPKICKCCGQYIQPSGRRRKPRANRQMKTDRFLTEDQPSNNIEDLHWEFVNSDVSLKDAYRDLQERSEFLDVDTYGPLWDSVAYFLYTVERHGTQEAAVERMLRCNLDSRAVRGDSIGCLIVSATEYLFFWRKDINNVGL